MMKAAYFPRLQKITALAKFAFSTTAFEVRGMKDTPAKYFACYLALMHTGHTKREIAKFFNINPYYMEKKINDLKVEFLVYPENYVEVRRLESLFLEMDSDVVK